MPRVSRTKKDAPAYTLTPEEEAWERRIHDSEVKMMERIEQMLDNPRASSKDIGFMASSLSKLRAEARLRYSLFGRMDLNAKTVEADPEKARVIATNYLASLSFVDRLFVYEGAYPDDTLVFWMAGMDKARRLALRNRLKAIEDGEATPPKDSEERAVHRHILPEEPAAPAEH